MDELIVILGNNFDFSFMFVINAMTYFIIKIVDDFDRNKPISIWMKRLILIMCIVVVGGYYNEFNLIDKRVLINSAILAPVFWSWIAAPICAKLGIDYKKVNNVISYDTYNANKTYNTIDVDNTTNAKTNDNAINDNKKHD